MEVWQWVVERAEYCKACRELEDSSQADCKDCEGRCPDLWEENREIWDLWLSVKTQWRVGIMGAQGFMCPVPIGLDYSAVHSIAETLDIDISPAVLHKLQALEGFEIKRAREDNNGS